jgi:hypothetical protein
VGQLFPAARDRELLLAKLDRAQAGAVEQENDDEESVDEEREEDGALEPAALGPLDPLDELFEVRGVGVVRTPDRRRDAAVFFVFDAEHLPL